MRLSRRLAVLSVTAVSAASLTAVASAAPAPDPVAAVASLPTSWPAVPVSPSACSRGSPSELATRRHEPLRVMVSGETTGAAARRRGPPG